MIVADTLAKDVGVKTENYIINSIKIIMLFCTNSYKPLYWEAL